MTWRFHLQELPSGRWIDRDLPLRNAQVITALSTPSSIRGSLSLGYQNVSEVREWGCAVIAEEEGRDPVFGIVDSPVRKNGGSLEIDAGGFARYPEGTPWLGADFAGVQVDPLDMVRKIWDHIQSFPDSNLGVEVDALTSPVRIGKPEQNVSFTTGSGTDVNFDAGPFRLAWWATEDLGKVIDDLALATPFSYRERSFWSGEGIRHRLELGYPRLGARREELRFEIGVNVRVIPVVGSGEYGSEIFLCGAGEGRTKIRADRLTRNTGRLRRVHVATDKGLTSRGAATAAARPILDRLSGAPMIDSLSIVDHPMAPLGSFQIGDEIRVQGDAGWGEMDLWVRVSETTVDCETGNIEVKVTT